MANGVATDLPFDVALAAAGHLVQSGRMIPMDRWVEHVVESLANDENEGIF